MLFNFNLLSFMFFSQKGLTFHFACSAHEPPFGPGGLLVGSLFLQFGGYAVGGIELEHGRHE